MTTQLKNGWSIGEAKEDGVYLRAFDEWVDDEDGDTFHLIGGKWYQDGEPRFCRSGVWKRIGDLPNEQETPIQRV